MLKNMLLVSWPLFFRKYICSWDYGQPNQPQILQPNLTNVDNTKSLLLTLKPLQLPPNTMRLLLHIELYC